MIADDHPPAVQLQLQATRPNEVCSWDMTKLKGPAKWTYYHLYVILDIFSRYVVGWMIAMREAAALAKRLIAFTCEKQGIEEGQLGLHADRGTSMESKPVEFLLVDLGVDETLKNRPEFPERCRVSSPGTTRSTGTRGSPTSPRRRSTTDMPRR